MNRVASSTDTVRTVLADAVSSWKATKIRKGSRDTDLTVRKARVFECYDQSADGQLPHGRWVITRRRIRLR